MPSPDPTRRGALRGALEVLSGALLVAMVATVAITGWVTVNDKIRAAAATPPGRDTVVLAAKDSVAAQAAGSGSDAERQAATYLATQPTAYWLTPEAADDTAVSALVLALAQQARDQDHATLALVVYGIPGRDCGSFSAGGSADAAAYDSWTASIGAALASVQDVRAIVAVEPDSLALAAQCGDVDERVADVRMAVDNLAGPNVFLYLDGAHSQWGPPADIAALIDRVDRADVVRGFAVNVANYQPSDNEVAYAHTLAGLLPGMHAIVDTSRNGAGVATTVWCNPSDQLVGAQSGALGDDVIDANLWVKPPGESDGTCNGGPAAGSWWPASAVALTRRAV